MKSETIKGAGFLSFDKDAGRYVGALELSIKNKIAIKAIGILTTKMPGGNQVTHCCCSSPPSSSLSQLGFGFTLNGVAV